MNSTYVVIDLNMVTALMIEEGIGEEDTVRQSLDGSKAILKFSTKYPNTMSGFKKYTHTEILQFLQDNTLTWNIPE